MRSCRRTDRIAAGALCVAAFVGGCAEKGVEVWEPQPTVQWSHVLAGRTDQVWNGFRILTPQPTRGLFPASMAVTRVAVEYTDDEAQPVRPYLYTDPRNEFLQWNRSLDDQMAVSEVFPIVERDLGGGPAVPLQILAAVRALHARFGLIYAVNELSRTETEIFGALYDADSAEPIALLHSREFSVMPPEIEEDDPEAMDLWEIDSRALARERFDGIVHQCIRSLIMHDERERIDAPLGWTPAGPIRPVEWPPTNLRTGRR